MSDAPDELAFQEIFDFIEARLNEFAANYPGNEIEEPIRFACEKVLWIGNSELEMIDDNEVIRACWDILRRFAMEYHLDPRYKHEWTLES